MNNLNPALIGQTEAMLNLLLNRSLEGAALTGPEWRTLRVADQVAVARSADDLAAAVTDRTGIDNARSLVSGLTERGLLIDARVSESGRELISSIRPRIDAVADELWAGLDPDELDASGRVLREVLDRARAALGREPL